MTPLSKSELKRQIKRLLKDRERGISLNLFAELSGISRATMHEVFITEKMEMSEMVQIRVNKAYSEWTAGKVRIMQRPDRTRYVDYRKELKPRIAPSLGLTVQQGRIKLKIGMKNRSDYSEPTLDEALRG